MLKAGQAAGFTLAELEELIQVDEANELPPQQKVELLLPRGTAILQLQSLQNARADEGTRHAAYVGFEQGVSVEMYTLPQSSGGVTPDALNTTPFTHGLSRLGTRTCSIGIQATSLTNCCSA